MAEERLVCHRGSPRITDNQFGTWQLENRGSAGHRTRFLFIRLASNGKDTKVELCSLLLLLGLGLLVLVVALLQLPLLHFRNVRGKWASGA